MAASPPEVGAERIVRIAVSPEHERVTGRYVHEDGIRPPSDEALDDAVSREAVGA